MNNGRLRSSFIYLANAVNDLRGNWLVLAAVLAPLVIAAALCLLPDALNFQHQIAQAFEPGTQSVEYTPVQTPYRPEKNVPAQRQPYPGWLTTTLHVVVLVITIGAKLLVLCLLARIYAREREPTVMRETVAVYHKAASLVPAFAWIAFLQVIAPFVAAFFLLVSYDTSNAGTFLVFAVTRAALVAIAAVVYLWLYFSQYALVFDNEHSFHALLFSRDQMRKRFFRVSIRVVVFLAVWSGFNSWAALAFIVVSRLVGPVIVLTGLVAFTIFLLDLISVSVSFATSAFFTAAGLRLYEDLKASVSETVAIREQAAMQQRVPLPGSSMS